MLYSAATNRETTQGTAYFRISFPIFSVFKKVFASVAFIEDLLVYFLPHLLLGKCRKQKNDVQAVSWIYADRLHTAFC